MRITSQTIRKGRPAKIEHFNDMITGTLYDIMHEETTEGRTDSWMYRQ